MQVRYSVISILSILILSTLCFASGPDRITAPIVTAQAVRLKAGLPMQARPEFDQGGVDRSFKMSYMTLLTVPSAQQKRALSKLLADQQNPRSRSYHKWLTPEQYADRFGLSPNDIRKLVDWLQSQGFVIVRTARARNWIAFSGTADQVEKAFQTEIHNYKVDGEVHFANTVAPTIPAALSGVVSGIRGLNNFRLKPQARRAQPGYTLSFQGSNYLFLAPGDIAAIYDIKTLYTNGIDGSGQTLAVIGQTGIFQSDLNNFRTGFGLSPISCTTSNDVITACNTANFQYLLVNGSPTNIHSDIAEADIDIEWSGATARNAQIIYVVAPDPNGGGVYDSLYYAIDNDVSPVITMSYTAPCELAEIGFFDADEAELQLANLSGITFMNSSGDTGAAECDYGNNLAVWGYAAAYPASSQYVTAVGGTSIPAIAPNEYTSTYWNSSNGSDGGSAKGYIPEQAWNDAEEFGLICSQASKPSFCTQYGITNWATAQAFIGIAAGGAGASNCVTVDDNFVCQSGFPQPVWQQNLVIPGTIPGQTTTPARYTPDVSLLASANFPGYIVCTQVNGAAGGGSSCAGGISNMLSSCLAGTGPCTIFGGTSVSSPVFAGIVTLLNQDVVANGVQSTPGLGNINPTLYTLAATPANGAFNPVTTGSTGAYSSGAWCQPGTPNSGVPADPWPTNLVCPVSGFLGASAYNFDPTTKYNLVTGLGSVNASHLAAAWLALGATTLTTLESSSNPQDFGSAVTFTATVTTEGPSAPTGTVTFKDGSTTLGTGTLGVGAPVSSPRGVVPSAQATFTTSSLSSGTHSITATYAGDTDNAGSTSDPLTQLITPPTFTLSTPSTPATVLSGQSTTSTFTVTATGTGVTTFAGDVTFACSGLPDATVICSAPTISAGTPSPVTETLTITTTGPNSNNAPRLQQRRRADNRLRWLPLAFPLAGIVMFGFAGRKLSKYSVAISLCTLMLLGLLVACGSSSSPPISVSVSGSSSSIFPQNAGWTNTTATFTATVSNDSGNKGVTWTVTTANGGTIQATDGTHATYTPPTIAAGLPASVTIKATSVADSSKSGSGSIRLTPTTVPGAYNLTVVATESTTQNSKPVTLTVQ
jgi:subtilase family serine protease